MNHIIQCFTFELNMTNDLVLDDQKKMKFRQRRWKNGKKKAAKIRLKKSRNNEK